MTDLPTQTVSPQERQATVDRLCDHYTLDHLETDEFERRLDLAYAARTSTELVALVRDLPALQPHTAPGSSLPAAAPAARIDQTRPVAEREFMMALMGGNERTGRWTPPRHISVLSVMGGAVLDFREATFATEEVRVTVVSMMGGTEIIVPPGVHVESSGVAIMGGFANARRGGIGGGPPGAPILRINGLAVMGGVDIKERLPGESEREARRRLKSERKAGKLGALPPDTES